MKKSKATHIGLLNVEFANIVGCCSAYMIIGIDHAKGSFFQSHHSGSTDGGQQT